MDSCINFRDVGEWVNLIADKKLLPLKRIYRSGKLSFVETAEQIGHPGTVINLRRGPDSKEHLFGAEYFHFPISNDYEKYETKNHSVQRWIQGIFLILEREATQFPLLFHCTSGKDRTGVIIAALLKALGIEHKIIIEEYLLSNGHVKEEWIKNSLDGFGNIEQYLKPAKLQIIRHKLAD